MTELIFDISRLLGRRLKRRIPTGVDRVDLAYIEHYSDRARAGVALANRLAVLSEAASQRLFVGLSRQDSVDTGVAFELMRGALAGAMAPIEPGAVYLNTGHSGLVDPRFALHLRKRGIQPMWMVHDLIPITHHEYCRPGECERHELRMRTALASAAAIFTNSKSTLAALTQFAKQSELAMPPAHVAPLAPGLKTTAAGSRPLAKPYFVVIATIEPRKNLAMLLQVWRQLAERHGEHAPHLVLIGQRGWECENVIDLLERSEPLRGLVIEQGCCSDAEVVTWLHHAQALLFPSFVEGYGLPLVEALHVGTPVIASALDVFREVAGNVPDYLDPLDGLGWLARVESYAQNGPERKAQLARMTDFVSPTWKQHFRIVDSLIGALKRGEDLRVLQFEPV